MRCSENIYFFSMGNRKISRIKISAVFLALCLCLCNSNTWNAIPFGLYVRFNCITLLCTKNFVLSSTMKAHLLTNKNSRTIQVVRIYSYLKEIKLHRHFIYRFFLCWVGKLLFCIKEIKPVFRSFIAWWKPRQSLWELSSRWKLSNASRVFTDLLSNSSKCSPRFLPGNEGTENMFYFSYISSDNDKNCNIALPKSILNINDVFWWFMVLVGDIG